LDLGLPRSSLICWAVRGSLLPVVEGGEKISISTEYVSEFAGKA
jgi:hypothetical protein